jgi:hypothetical protein
VVQYDDMAGYLGTITPKCYIRCSGACVGGGRGRTHGAA